MKYIKKLTLENFQSHKYTELYFNEGLNVIVGPSDSGKSAIIRALKWVLYNEPSGDYFIRENENQCSVTIHTNDGYILKRYRTKSKNGYTLIYPNGEELILEGIGTSVPEEIVNAIGIRKIQLDSDESTSINVGEQLDGPFLLSEKTSTRANAIGRLVGVNILDDAIRETAKDIKNTSLKKKNLEETLSNLSEEINKYKYIDDLMKVYSLLKELMITLEDKNQKLEKYTMLKINLNNIISRQEEINDLLSKLKSVDKMGFISKILENNIVHYSYLDRLNIKIQKINKDITIIENILYSLANLEKINIMYNNLDSKLNKYKHLILLNEKYKKNIREIKFYESIILNLRNLNKIEDDYNFLKLKCEKYYSLIKYRNSLSEIKFKTDYLININNKINTFADKVNLEALTIKLERLRILNIDNNKLKKIDYDITNIKNTLEKLNNERQNILDRYRKILSSYEKCPFCASDIDNNKIDHIIKYHLGG